MAKKRSASSARVTHRDKSAKIIPDSAIDFSDIPELTQAQLRRARPVGRPRLSHPKKLIAIRLSPKLIYKLQKLARKKQQPYQTLMQELLEKALKGAA